MSKNIEWKKSTIDYDKLNQLTTQKLAAAEWASNNLKGYKHSENSKDKFRKAKIGTKRDIDSVKKSIEGTKQTRWQQTLNRLSKEDIINAQKKHGNHQSNTMNELGISFTPYKKLCKHYDIELKKSPKEKTEWAIQNQSEAVLVWKCSKTQPFRKIGKPKKFYSVSQCCRAFVPNLHKGNMLRNMKNGTPYRDMFFEKIVP